MPKHATLHVGVAGQLATGAEFAIRGYNVAVPMVDTGEDLFVSNPENGQLWQVQVKTSRSMTSDAAKPVSEGFQFATRKNFLLSSTTHPPVLIVLAMYSAHRGGWVFLCFQRTQLATLHKHNSVGTVYQDSVVFHVGLHHDGCHKGKAMMGKVDVTDYLSDFLPSIL